MKITAALDRGHWTNQLQKLADVMGQTMDEVVKGQARLIIRDCIRMTPPFSRKPYKPLTESFSKQHQAGRDAVRKSILRVFKPANSFWSLTSDKDGNKGDLAKAAAKAAKRGDLDEIKRLNPRSKAIQRTIALERMADAATFDAARDAKTGKPRKGFGGILVHRGTVPTFEKAKTEKGVTSYAGLAKLFRAKAANVGIAKAGWLHAADQLGLPAKDCPAWVRKHKGKASGASVYRFVEGVKASVVCGNGVPYIQATGAELRIVQAAMRNRDRNLYKQISMAMKAKAKRMGVKKYWTV